MAKGMCSVEGCVRPVRTRGLCNPHHLKLLRRGDPLWERSWQLNFWRKAGLNSTSECQEWTGDRDRKGYGAIEIKLDGVRKRRRAHVVMWEMFHGPVPVGLEVCHSCDNPPCIRIGHLWLGTHAENMADMHAKGRSRWQR